MNKPIDYLQELKRDVSTKGILTPLQKRCFEKLEETLNQPVKDLKKLYDEISYRLMPNPARDLKMYEFLREVKQLIEIHYQSNPSLEEIKQEWEDDGWEWCTSINNRHIVLVKEKSDKYNGNYLKMIRINSITKTCSCYIDESYSFDDITFQEHIRLTKTFRALGWEV